METRVGYAAVGLFVILLAMALVGAGLWFSADLTGREYQRYSVYFTEAVTGLTTGATVRYRGVDVGQVHAISLDPERPDRVHLLLDIETNTPLREDTVARLSMQGLAGLVHLELTGGTVDAGPPIQPEDEPYPVLETAPSLMSRLDDALDKGLAALDRITAQVEKLLTDENLETFGGTLRNLETLTSSLNNSASRLDSVMEQAGTTLDQGGKLTARLEQELPELVARLDRTLDGVDRATAALGKASEDVGSAATEGSASLQAITDTTLPQLLSLMRELEGLTDSMGVLTNELIENPSLLIYGRPRRPPGPGEE